MTKMLTQRGRLLRVLNGREVDRMPVASFTQTGITDLMDATGASWPDAHRNASLMARLGLAGHDIAGFEAVRIPFGLITEAGTMGCQIDYHEDRRDFNPGVRAGLKSLDAIRIPDPTEGLMGMTLDAVRLCREGAGEDVPIIVGVTGPFTIAGHLRGLTEMMIDLVDDPDLIHGIERTTQQVVTEFSRRLHEEGADIIVLIEPTGAIIGLEFFDQFCAPYLRKAISDIKAPVVLHICGHTLPLIESMISTGAKGLSIDQTTGVAAVKEAIRGRAALIGNIDPVSLLLQGKPADVEAGCRRAIDEGVSVLAPGCGLAPATPLQNVKAMVRAGLDYGKVR